MTADEGLTAPIPHQHGGTDAPECTPFGIPCRPSTPADDGLPAAVARVKAARSDHHWNFTDGCMCGWTGDHFEDWKQHAAEAVARAAREDVAETVREARAAELESAAESVLAMERQCTVQKTCHRADHGRLIGRAESIRAGEA